MSPTRAVVLRGDQWAGRLVQALARPPLDPREWMEQHARILKRDRYSRVGLLELGGELNCLKFYRPKSIGRALLFRLARGRGVRAYDRGEALARRGVPVPRPRACLLVPGGMMLLTEGLRDARDLKALWRDGPPPADPGGLLESAGRTLGMLHLAGYAHGDSNWGNLLWSANAFYLVDLEAVRTAPPGGRRQARDLARFTLDAEELAVGGKRYRRFLAAYCAVTGLPRETVLERLLPPLRKLRARHRRRYGARGAPLL